MIKIEHDGTLGQIFRSIAPGGKVVIGNRLEAQLGRYLKVPLKPLRREKVLLVLDLLRLPAYTMAHCNGDSHLSHLVLHANDQSSAALVRWSEWLGMTS